MSSLPKKTGSIRISLARHLGYLMIVAGGLAVFATYARYESHARVQHARDALSAELGTRADKIQEWLLRVDRTLGWFRAEDLSGSDRVAATVRMLRTEKFVSPATNLLLFSTTGRLLAATLPLPEGGGSLAAQSWFKAIEKNPAEQTLQISGCARDPFGTAEGIMLYRAIYDHDMVAGYIGSFLAQQSIAPMSRDDDPANGTISFALTLPSQGKFGCPAAPMELRPQQHASILHSVLSRLVNRSPLLASASAIESDRLIQPGNLRLTARADTLESMSDDDWVALTYRASYVTASLLIIMALLGSLLHRFGRSQRRRALAPPAIPASDGADWMWELDNTGNLVGLAGNAPEHLLPPNGRSLAEAAGPVGSSDMRWDRLNAAICGKHAFEGLLVPFQLPGREGLLTIFELSGQPVLASGGFWGTASLISEESVARAPQPAMARQEFSAA